MFASTNIQWNIRGGVMPHCRLGHEIKAGDKVIIYATVESVQEGIEFCNVTVRTDFPMPPYTAGTTVTLNTRQVDSIAPALFAGEIVTISPHAVAATATVSDDSVVIYTLENTK